MGGTGEGDGGEVRGHIPKLEVLATLQGKLLLLLAHVALQPENDLLGSLGLLVEDGLGLTTITALLACKESVSVLVRSSRRYVPFDFGRLSPRGKKPAVRPFVEWQTSKHSDALHKWVPNQDELPAGLRNGV